MARQLSVRLRITADLQAMTALHVGGGGTGPEADLLVAEDGLGQPYVPGTSLAGALRAWTEAALGQELAARLWGDLADNGASHVIVEDASLEHVVLERRDGVGIDRRTRSAAQNQATSGAAQGIRFDRTVIAAGAVLKLQLTVELPTNEEQQFTAAVGSLLWALQHDGMSVGAAQTRGLGHLKLERLRIRREMLDREGVLAGIGVDPYSRGSEIELKELIPKQDAARRADMTDLIFSWRPDGPLMVRSGSDGLGVDSLPSITRNGEIVRFLLPGASVKGALRSVAERIVRTVLDIVATEETFLEQIDVPLVRELFGSPGRAKHDPKRDDRVGRGALAVRDCHSQKPVSAERWDAVVRAADPKSAQEAAREAGLNGTHAAMHVAIDRWTGAPADGALFSVLELGDTAWEPIRLRLDLSRVSEANRLAVQALLWLVLVEFRQGRIPLGFATNRGLGAVIVEKVGVSTRACDFALASADGALDLDSDPGGELRKAWTDWIARTRREAAAERTPA